MVSGASLAVVREVAVAEKEQRRMMKVYSAMQFSPLRWGSLTCVPKALFVLDSQQPSVPFATTFVGVLWLRRVTASRRGDHEQREWRPHAIALRGSVLHPKALRLLPFHRTPLDLFCEQEQYHHWHGVGFHRRFHPQQQEHQYLQHSLVVLPFVLFPGEEQNGHDQQSATVGRVGPAGEVAKMVAALQKMIVSSLACALVRLMRMQV